MRDNEGEEHFSLWELCWRILGGGGGGGVILFVTGKYRVEGSGDGHFSP
jgi:hypothetical protein